MSIQNPLEETPNPSRDRPEISPGLAQRLPRAPPGTSGSVLEGDLEPSKNPRAPRYPHGGLNSRLCPPRNPPRPPEPPHGLGTFDVPRVMKSHGLGPAFYTRLGHAHPRVGHAPSHAPSRRCRSPRAGWIKGHEAGGGGARTRPGAIGAGQSPEGAVWGSLTPTRAQRDAANGGRGFFFSRRVLDTPRPFWGPPLRRHFAAP